MKPVYVNIAPLLSWLKMAVFMKDIHKGTLKIFKKMVRDCVLADDTNIQSGTFIPDSGLGIYGVKCKAIIIEEENNDK